MTHQQRRLRRENYNGDDYVPFYDRTYENRQIKLAYYGTIQDLYDLELQEGYDEYNN
jgi:hypothetical protein